jgi:subtilisin-like proprotein convertase family protein
MDCGNSHRIAVPIRFGVSVDFGSFAIWLLSCFLCGLGAFAATCSAPPSGIVGWWPGDGNSTTLVGTNNGTLQGGATATGVGMVGQAFSFNGSTAYIQIPDSPDLRPTNLTVEAWVLFTSLNSSGNSTAGQQYIVFKQNTRSSNFEGFYLGKRRQGGRDNFTFVVSSSSGSSAEVDSSTAIATNVWYHVAGVRGSNFIQLYVNGVSAGQATVNFAQNYGNYPLYFGTSGESYWDHKLAGLLDEVSLYNRALSASEITAIYNAGAAGKCKPVAAPIITTQPLSQTVAVGSTVGFNVVASGAAPFSYQWQLNGGPIVNATSTSLSLNNVQTGDSGNYSVVVTNSVGAATSAVAVLSVLLPPSIVSQPQSLTTVAGTTANFSANGTGSPPLNYQWQLNGSNLSNNSRVSGATSTSLAIGNVQASDAGNYTLVANNAVGVVTSAVAVLTVNGPPSITAQPTGQSVSTGANVSFNVTASGTAPLSYQWLFNGNILSDGGQISGSTSSTLALSNVQGTNAGSYSVFITNVVGAVTSSAALLSISSPANAATFTNAALITIPDSGTATPYPSTINVSGMAGVVSKVTLSLKQLSHTYIHDVDVLLAGPAGQRTLVFAHVGGTLGVTNITLSFDDAASASLPVSSQVVSGTFKPTNGGGTVSFPSPAPAAPYGATLSGFNGTAPNGTWSLYVLDDSAGDKGTISGGWTLSITSSNSPPTIVTQPASQNVPVGATVSFNVTASGTAPLSYQWQMNGNPLANATTSSLTLNNVQTGDSGNYNVVVSNSVGSTTSAVAVLNVLVPPAMVSQPQSLTTVAGSTANFSAGATGSLPMNYQWRFNGSNLSNGGRITGATSSALAISTVQASDAGNYTLVVTNAVGVVTSAVATLTVNGPPTITAQPTGQSVLTGANVNFNVTASGTAPLSYQWLFNGTALSDGGQVSGSTSSTLALSNVQSTNAGSYSVTITNVVGAVTSSAALLSISSPANSATFTNAALITIPDSGTATPYPSTINVAGMAGVVSKVTLSLKQLSHTYIHDVDVLLAGPAGQSTLVFAHIGGTLGVTNITLNFDDAASASLPASSQVVSGTFKPTNGGGTVSFPTPAPASPYGAALSVFNGTAPNGTWSLYVLDDSAGDKGTISGGWTLTVLTASNTPPTISSVVSQTTTVSTPTAPISFTVGDTETPAANLTVSGQSSNPTLVPNGNIVFGGSGANRTVTITPTAGQSGTATITLSVTDTGGATASTQFGLSVAGVSASTTFANTALITIPDSGAATPYPSTINVTGMSGNVSKVTISLKQLSHTYVHDVNVMLAGPAGQKTLIMSHVGGTLGVTNITLNFDDAAAASLPASSQVVSGTFKPTNGGGTVTFPSPAPAAPYGSTLSVFNGSAANGVWSLYVLDDAVNDKGTISGGWTLTLSSSNMPPQITSPPSSQTITAGASAAFNVLASGAGPLGYQWLFYGTNLSDNGQFSGTLTSTLSLNNAQLGNAGPYSVLVTNSFGSTTSTVANLTVVLPSPAQVVNLPASGIQAFSASLNGQVVSTGADVPTVTLFYGPIDGGTTPSAWAQSAVLGLQSSVFSYQVTALLANTPYFYTVMASNSVGTSWAVPSATFTTLSSNTNTGPVAVLMHHYDTAHTGANLNETILNTANVNTNQFGLLYSRAVDDQIYAQPLIMTNVSIPGKGLHNILIVATVNDSVYAFDADNPSVATPYWNTSFLGTTNVVPPNSSDIVGSPCGSYALVTGNFGIIGTPVIDPVSSTLYLVARTKEFGTNFVQRLHALDLTTGIEKPNSPVIITATYAGTGAGSVGGVLVFDSLRQHQRSALTLVNGVVYICWASHCDWDPYHGWLIGYDATSLQQVLVYNTSPNGTEAGIWMSGAGPASDYAGNLYITVGNGTVGSTGNPRDLINRGESYLKLTPNGSTLNVVSWFTPYDWPTLEANDWDLGSAGALLIPGTTLLFSGSKEGKAYLVNRDNMGGLSYSSADTNVVQSFQVTATNGDNNIHGAPVWWDGPSGSYAYVQGESDYLRQYKFDRANGVFMLPAYAQSPTTAPVGGMPGGFITVSANGVAVGSGIVWASLPLSGDAVNQTRPGILRAYDAQNVSRELWNSEQVSGRDSVGNFAKYCPPVVANGRVYLPTFSNRLNVYGLGLTPPLNDTFASAQTVSGSSGSITANNFNATKQPGEPNPAGNTGGASVWYTWTAPSGSPVTFDTALSSFDTLLAVYTGSSLSGLNLIASNNDMNANSTRSRLTFTPIAGTVYMIAVDGASGARGNVTLRWVQASTPLPNLSIVGSAVNPRISTESFSASSCAVVEGLIQAGTRTIIRFTTQTENSGTANLTFGNPANNPLFVWAPCHSHYHFNNYVSYRLRDANGNLAASGLKAGFCILDAFRWDFNSATGAVYTCSNQGIQKGWGDLSDSSLDGQWIDVTGLSPGNYTLELETNPEGLIQENNYADNVTTVPIAIGDSSAAPANDNFANAQALSGGFSAVQANNQNATVEPGEPNHAGNPGGHSLWFQWTAPITKSVTIDTIGSSFNTLLAVYTGTSVSSLTPIASNDDISSPDNLQSSVTFNANVGVVYDIAVDGYNGATGSVVLTINQTIQNDSFNLCTYIGGVSGRVYGSNSGATKEAGEPNHVGNTGGASVWYCWTAPITGLATFDTLGSTFNTVLAVYTGSSVSNLTAVAGNDDIDPVNGNFQSRVAFNAVGLTTYHIAIDGFDGATGDSVLNWNQAAVTGSALVAALPPQQSASFPAQVERALMSFRFLTEGELQITIAGQPLQRYRIEVSPDLIHWTTLVTTSADSSGTAYFTDKTTHSTRHTATKDPVCGSNQIAGVITAHQGARFYRAAATVAQ